MSSKPQVACLLQMFGVGGMPKWLYRLAGELQDEFDFTFIATHSGHVTDEYRQVARVVVLPYSKWAIAAYLLARRIDIAQVANLHLYVDAARLAGVPVVIERVDGARAGAAFGSKLGLDAIVASTKGVIPKLQSMISAQKISLIYNGIDVLAYRRVAPQRHGFAESDILVGRTSRLAGGKNISLLIQAVIAMRKELKFQNIRLVICGGDTTQAGSAPMFARLQQEAAALGSSVVFTGEVIDPAPITAGYDIATCTSLPDNEGIPNSLIEAMAAGKPVVASAVDDIPELVEDGVTGLLFENNSLEQLITALKKLALDLDLRKKMGAAGLDRVQKDFDLHTQSRKYADLYRSLLARKGRHSLRFGLRTQ